MKKEKKPLSLKNMKNHILINNLKLTVKIGCYEDEKLQEQEIIISLKLYGNFNDAEKTDQIEKTINYVEVISDIKKTLQEKHHTLVEHACKKVSKTLFKNHKMLEKIELTLLKPHAITEAEAVGYYLEENRF